MNVEGAIAVHPASPDNGGVADVVILNPDTLTLSDAVNAVTGIFTLGDGDAAVKEVTAGAVTSDVEYENK